MHRYSDSSMDEAISGFAGLSLAQDFSSQHSSAPHSHDVSIDSIITPVEERTVSAMQYDHMSIEGSELFANGPGSATVRKTASFSGSRRGGGGRPRTGSRCSNRGREPCSRYKISIAGKSGVGKTSLFLRAQGHGFSEIKTQETGVDSFSYQIDDELASSDNNLVEYTLHDTAGMETYNSLSLGNYYKNSHCILLVYDISSMSSLEYAMSEFENIVLKDKCPDAHFVLVRNKSDLASRSSNVTKVDEQHRFSILERNLKLATTNSATINTHAETSAKTNLGVNELFNITLPILLRHAKPKLAEQGGLYLKGSPKKTGGSTSSSSSCCS